MKNVQLTSLIQFYTAVLVSAGLPEDRAEKIAGTQCSIQAFGIATHGLRPLHHLIKAVEDSGGLDAAPVCLRSTGAVEVYDCTGCLSIENIRFGVRTAGDLAAEHAIGFVSLHNTGWIGALGYHLAELAAEGFLVMGWVHSSEFHGTVPFGGMDARFSTNPMGYAFPTSSDPVVVDFSTSSASNGKSYTWIAKGEKAPEEIYLDSGGRPTADPSVLKHGGAMLPTGGLHFGYKGTALSLLIEAMTAVSGAVPVNREKEGGHNAHVFALRMDPESTGQYQSMIDGLFEWILSSRPFPGSSGPRIPGKRGWEALAAATKHGLDIDDSLWGAVTALSSRYGIAEPV